MSQSRKQEIVLHINRLENGDSSRPQYAVLQLETSKYYNGGLISDATVYWIGLHSRQNCIALGDPSGGDYGKRMLVARDKKATQGNIDRQHAEVFTNEVVQTLTQAAKNHYAAAIHAGIDKFHNTYTAAA